MEKEIPAVVPNFKLKPLEPEPTSTTTYPTTTTTTAHSQTIAFLYTKRKKSPTNVEKSLSPV